MAQFFYKNGRISHARLSEAILNEGQLKGDNRLAAWLIMSQLASEPWTHTRKALISQLRMQPALVDRLGALVQIKGDNETVLARLRAVFASNPSAVAGINDLITMCGHLKVRSSPYK